MKICPCGSGVSYSECCEQYILGKKLPPTAEALMRSRYSAYVEHNINYIVETCLEKDEKHNIDVKETEEWSQNSTWLGLKILSTSQGGINDEEGIVEFEATYEREGLKDVHHEKASFQKSDGKWYYNEGSVTPKTIVRSSPKVGRNEPCPCGSGKKFKHCCGR